MVEREQIESFMGIALDEARAALEHDDVPVGAVVIRIDTGEVLARRHNERELTNDPTAHAEILAVRDAAVALGSWRLEGCALVVTLEPCAMCAGALMNARIGQVIFGAEDLKAGALGSRYQLLADPRLNHECDVVHGVRVEESARLLRGFFTSRRA